MNIKQQQDIQNSFEKMYQAEVTPWKDHPMAPTLSRFFSLLKAEKNNAKILDIGCGDGWISLKAVRNSFEVWGVDSSKTAIERAKKTATQHNLMQKVHFQVGDALHLPYEENFFDAILDRGLFHHILPDNRLLYLENIIRVLKKGSLFYLAVFSTANTEGIGQRFTPSHIEDLFGPFFEIFQFDPDPYPSFTPAHLLHFILKGKS